MSKNNNSYQNYLKSQIMEVNEFLPLFQALRRFSCPHNRSQAPNCKSQF